GHRVADVARLVLRERPVRRVLDLVVDRPRHEERRRELELRRRVDGDDAVELAGLRRVDAVDARVRVRAAHERDPEHPREADVVDVAATPGDQLRVLLAQLAGADDPGAGLRDAHAVAPTSAPVPRATDCTALT